MALKFDGRAFAQEKLDLIKDKVAGAKLAIIIVGDGPASKLYVSLKKKKAQELGIIADVHEFSSSAGYEEIRRLVEKLNNDKGVNGIMIQLPLPKRFKNETKEIINHIDSQKDVDGLREDSSYLHPTSKAVIEILNQAKLTTNFQFPTTVCVVGARGMVGRPLVKELEELGYEVLACHSQTENLKEKCLQGDVVISATGKKNLITGDMVKDGVVLIDVGSPKGDIDPSAALRASFYTPVPGGVGPVTIACLLENLAEARYNHR